ncbi:hypothetical protein BDV59DRAFT_90821 [Aspergillus ambiguus]|uniref:uncharacterized protein n=1 Tax=Aspergillus ambiguus TaxID=176160 RepID=UPI003CCE240A
MYSFTFCVFVLMFITSAMTMIFTLLSSSFIFVVLSFRRCFVHAMFCPGDPPIVLLSCPIYSLFLFPSVMFYHLHEDVNFAYPHGVTEAVILTAGGKGLSSRR